jgi:DNA modification methylase
MSIQKIINKDFKKVQFKHKADLFIVDPPYGQIVKEKYDKLTEDECVDLYMDVAKWCSKHAKDGATAYIFGGIGKPKMRPFFKFLYTVEKETDWRIHNYITWGKKRAYGTAYNYLFTREEIAMLVKGDDKPFFNVPYLDKERDKAWDKGFQTKYKSKSKFLRRTNVWTDITEIMQGLKCKAQKPTKLYKVMIETSCPVKGFVVDPMCGSGTTAVICKDLGINALCVEKDLEVYQTALARLEDE